MEWRKSSHSGNASDCVELRHDLKAVRDSKHPSTTLPLPKRAVRALLAHVTS
ncbi:DUF397 domain-containing protein [Actinokineospora bangkokensis]|uniref:DUF397 domain-containing protein n=1 Tax=Actinokineospora bangkokensis TaxID=1193682 RepID=UPI0011773681|nr:DUF397 domain-containing protein [Actinokineospora bangkokensis]